MLLAYLVLPLLVDVFIMNIAPRGLSLSLLLSRSLSPHIKCRTGNTVIKPDGHFVANKVIDGI